MKSEIYSGSTRNHSPLPKQDTSSASEMLTPSEIEQLRQEKKESNAFFQKAFAHLK